MKRLILFILLIPTCVSAQLMGKVVSVADGDTFTMLVNNEQIRIRLHGIDCPEKSQDFGNAAKKFLSDLVFGKIVSVKETDTDKYGRTIGIVKVDTINVNEQLLKAGLAWHYKHYDKNAVWAAMEEEAKKNKKGLWAMNSPVPPWEYRRAKRN